MQKSCILRYTFPPFPSSFVSPPIYSRFIAISWVSNIYKWDGSPPWVVEETLTHWLYLSLHRFIWHLNFFHESVIKTTESINDFVWIGKHADMSSFYRAPFYASAGNDNNETTYFHTNWWGEYGAWWRVDLNESSCIQAVRLVNEAGTVGKFWW